MKCIYEQTEQEIVLFEKEDIITTSAATKGNVSDIYEGNNTEAGWSDII